MTESSVLITGGNGYLGIRLAEHLLENSSNTIQLYVHARDKSELDAKNASLASIFHKHLQDNSLRIIGGEIGNDDAFDLVETKSIRQIIHSAAVTRFTVEEDLAQRVNVQGSANLLDLARKCPNLAGLQFLSTVYASGLRTGKVKEESLTKASAFSNHYERSKWEAEQLAETKYSDLPINIIRIATLVADNDNGVVSQQNAFHNTLKLFYYGLLSLFPGEKETPIYFVTGDFVVKSIIAILDKSQCGNYYHVCHRLNETATLEQLLDTVFAAFESYADFRTRRVLKPLWSDIESFELLEQGIGSLSGGVMAQAMSSVAPFAKQLFAPKDFCNENLRSVLVDYKAPDPKALIDSTARYLADTKWGRQLQHAN